MLTLTCLPSLFYSVFHTKYHAQLVSRTYSRSLLLSFSMYMTLTYQYTRSDVYDNIIVVRHKIGLQQEHFWTLQSTNLSKARRGAMDRCHHQNGDINRSTRIHRCYNLYVLDVQVCQRLIPVTQVDMIVQQAYFLRIRVVACVEVTWHLDPDPRKMDDKWKV